MLHRNSTHIVIYDNLYQLGTIGEAAYKAESPNFPIQYNCSAIWTVKLAEKASHMQRFANIAAC